MISGGFAIRWAAVLKEDEDTQVSTATLNNLKFNTSSSQTGRGDPSTVAERTGTGATVYSIGLLDDPDDKVHEYMWRVSSESPDSDVHPDDTTPNDADDGYDYSPTNPDNNDQSATGGSYYVTPIHRFSGRYLFEHFRTVGRNV